MPQYHTIFLLRHLPAEYLQYLPRGSFAPIVGPDEASIASNQTELTGPLYNQPPSWHLDARYPLPKQASSPSAKVVFKAPPPSVIPGIPKPPPPGLPTVMVTSPKHPTKAPPPTLVLPDITRPVTGVIPFIPGVTAKSKPPPPTVPIGPAMPEGQLPPYPIPKQTQQQPKAQPWQCGAVSVVARDHLHESPPVIRSLPTPYGPIMLPPRRIGEASTPSGDQHWDP